MTNETRRINSDPDCICTETIVDGVHALHLNPQCPVCWQRGWGPLVANYAADERAAIEDAKEID